MNWHGALIAAMIMAILCAPPVAFAIIVFYRRAVRRSMERTRSVVPDGVPASAAEQPPGQPLEWQTLDPGGGIESAAARELLRRADGGVVRVTLAYAVAGLAFAAVITTVYFVLENIEFLPRRTLYTGLVLLWPIAPTVALVAVGSPRLKQLTFLTYVALLLAVAGEYWGDVAKLFVLLAAIPTLLVLPLAARPLRPAAPVALAPLLVFAVAFLASPWLQLFAITRLQVLGVHATTVAKVALVAAAIAVAWLVLAAIARAYRNKLVSDQMLVVGFWWLIFALSGSISLAGNHGLLAALGLLALVAFSGTAAIALAMHRRSVRSRPAVRLLLLRVFGARRRSERLIEELGLLWRHVGSIQMIAGTDLATANFEPHELFDFVTARLNRRFIGDPQALEAQLEAMDLDPDPDGRYRVNEFFCHADTWRLAVTRLAGSSDAVVMDLRGFTRANEGCRFELEHLLHRVDLRRTVLMINADTDVGFLRSILGQAWSTVAADSPNRRYDHPTVRLVPFERQNRAAMRHLLIRVAESATLSTRTDGIGVLV